MKKEVIVELMNEMKKEITEKLSNPLENYEFFKKVLEAYNRWNEDEKDGNRYIFDITNTEDVKCCLDGGLTIREVAELYNNSQCNKSVYFFFGHDIESPLPFADIKGCAIYLTKMCDEFLPYVLCSNCVEYRLLWDELVSHEIVNSDLI
jgi:hypothetical protein